MQTSEINVNQTERLLSTVIGGGLLFRNLARPSIKKLILSGALLYRGLTGHSFVYQALGINTADTSQKRLRGPGAAPQVACAITIGKPARDLYSLWRDPQRLSQVMGDVADVTAVGEQRLHWRVPTPFGRTMEWDTQTVEDRPGQLIRWRTVEGAPVPHEGWVEFAPAPQNRGTEVTLHFRFDQPGGTLGGIAIQRLEGVLRLLADKVLHRFKSLAETGEIPTLKNNPSAREMVYR